MLLISLAAIAALLVQQRLMRRSDNLGSAPTRPYLLRPAKDRAEGSVVDRTPKGVTRVPRVKLTQPPRMIRTTSVPSPSSPAAQK
jgi:hypothetical protein